MAETLSGIGVSPGVAAGPVAQMAAPPVVPTDATPSGDPESENQAAMAAMRAVSASLEERGARGPGEDGRGPAPGLQGPRGGAGRQGGGDGGRRRLRGLPGDAGRGRAV